MTPRDMRQLMSSLIYIDRSDLEAAGIITRGSDASAVLEEFFNNPCKAVMRLNNDQQQGLIDHIFQGVKS